MFIAAVLSPDPSAFVAWCRANRYRCAGDGAEGESGKWLAVRVLGAEDLIGLEVDRVDYAIDFWRRGEGGDRTAMFALDSLARTRLRRAPPS